MAHVAPKLFLEVLYGSLHVNYKHESCKANDVNTSVHHPVLVGVSHRFLLSTPSISLYFSHMHFVCALCRREQAPTRALEDRVRCWVYASR